MKFSIIIPTFNEAHAVGPRVTACFALLPTPEVIVADGGSFDRTPERARDAGALLVRSARGRGDQMNAGAVAASGDVLVFLHVDVALPQASWSGLCAALADRGLIGGAFRRRFDSRSRLLALGSRLADLRGDWLQIYLGDQTIFARRAAFDEAGGYPSSLLFEDLEFSRRLRHLGRTTLIRNPVLASSRRFDDEGNALRLLKNLCLMAAYEFGVHPNRLARRYYGQTIDSTSLYAGHRIAPTGNRHGCQEESRDGGGA